MTQTTPETVEQDRANQRGLLLTLPGFERTASKSQDLEKATRITIESRRAAGHIMDLDDAVVALAIANAQKLDSTTGVGRPSGRAKLLGALSDVLEELPAPEALPGGILPPYRAALTGERPEQHAEPSPADEPLPQVEPPTELDGITATGVRNTLRARHAAGLSTHGYAAHEALALMAADDVDRALTVGAPSGYAMVAGVMATILDRLPRPAAAANDTSLDQLLAAVEDVPSPFTALPPAAHHPERDETWQTEGHEIAALNRAMGRHFMPWQRLAADVATEYRIDAFGFRRYRYHTVIIVVPRQSGKTDLTIPVQLHRSLTRKEPAAVWYTAQSGQDARKRIMELVERVEGTPLSALYNPTRSNGAEGVRVVEQPGSHVTRFSPTFSALHGEHPHLVTFDEFWRYTKDLGDALIGAVEPGQITLGSRAQTWMVSTMGTAQSDFMNELVAAGRAGEDPGVCYIEYSLPDGLDPFDPDSWPLFHPALGNTIAVEDLAQRARRAATDPARRATWMRAYCNRLVASDGSLIDLASWDDMATPVEAPDRAAVTIGYEVAPDNAAAAVVASWTDEATGRPATRIVRQAPGTAWLVPYLHFIHAEWQAPIVADGAGPSARFTRQLDEDGIPVRRLTLPEYGEASEAWLAAAGTDGTLIHDGSDELRAQVAAIQVRTSNGVRRISRDGPRPVPAVIASAIALYAAEHPQAEAQTIVI